MGMTKTATATQTSQADEAECHSCGDTGYEMCNHQGTERDEHGWCWECDAEFPDTDEPVRILCRVGHG